MRHILKVLLISAVMLLCFGVAAYADTETEGLENTGDASACEHQWSDWVTDQEASCTTEGHQYRECSLCQEKEEVVLPVAHNWSEWGIDYEATCGEAGQESRYCLACGTIEEQTIPPTGIHDWDVWDTVTSATIFRTGVREHYCMECGTVQRGTIAKLIPFAKFTATKYTVSKGSSKQMRSVLRLANGDTVKSWKTNKKKVVSITKTGKIKAKKKGTAKITVTLKSGKKATCKIKVVKKSKKASSGGSVYITRTGIRYHCDKNCWGLRNANALYKVSLSTAKKKGLTPCHVCY